ARGSAQRLSSDAPRIPGQAARRSKCQKTSLRCLAMMQFVATIGRNDPCPCQSGKKYKKCCLPAHDARAAEQRRANDQRNAVQRPDVAAVAKALAPMLAFDDDDGLDDLS